MGLFSIKIWTCKNREKKGKKSIFIDIMHGIEVEDDAKMNYNQLPQRCFKVCS